MYNIIYDKKILFEDGTIFDVAEYPIETEPSIFAKRAYFFGETRETIRVTIVADYEDAKERFIPGAHWFVRQYEISPEGEIDYDTYEDYDKSDYCIIGEIVDHLDGRITIYAGKKTKAELTQDALDQIIILMMGV